MINIRENENVIAIYRRHKFIIFMEIFPLVFFFFVILFSAFYLTSTLSPEFELIYPLIFFVALIFFHMFWIIAFIAIADYYLDIWILTDKRVITVEQRNLFSRVISEFELSKIQEISTDIHGFIPTLLNYGDVRVRTASENTNFIFKQVDNPNAVRGAIMTAEQNFNKFHKSE